MLKAVERLGYSPNSVAKNLRTLKSCKLLVTVPDISNPFFALILQGIEEAAQKNGYAVLVGDTRHDEMREERYAQMLKQKEADGLIFLGHRLPRVAASVVQESAPYCAPIVNGCEFSAELGVPSVHIDNAKAAAEAMDHLYGLGHREIGVVTGPLLSPLSRDRLAGARASARGRGLEQDLVVMQGDFSIRSGAAAAEALLQRASPPTAVFCFNDEMAMGVIAKRAAAASRSRAISPSSASTTSALPSAFDPALTTIAQPMRAIGEGTVRLLLEILNGSRLTPVSVTLPHALQIRASTAPPRHGAPD